MFKRLLLASTAAVAVSASAFAADLPYRKAPAPYVAVPYFTWTGFYIGANAGYAFEDNNRITTVGNNGPVGGPSTIFNVATGARPGTVRLDADGFTGGGQVGYNYQFGSVVVGIEADASYTDLRRSVTVIGTTGAPSTFRTDTSFVGTVRGRVGYAWDRLLVFGTGGLAFGDVRNSAFFFATPGAGGFNNLQFAGTRADVETGWTAGGGVEYALTGWNWFGSATTIKAEALYYDLGRRNVLVADTGFAPAATRGQSYTSRFENSGIIARAGINFKFGTY